MHENEHEYEYELVHVYVYLKDWGMDNWTLTLSNSTVMTIKFLIVHCHEVLKTSNSAESEVLLFTNS